MITRALGRRLLLWIAMLICVIGVAGCGQAPATPAASSTDQAESDSAAAVLQAYRDFGGEIVTLDTATPTTTVDIVDLTGTVPAYSLTQGDPPCSGFVRTAPNLVFALAAGASTLQVAFAGNQATNLVVVEEGEEIHCPTPDAATLTPEFVLEQPQAGRYGVWVGRIDMENPVNGKLTVSIE